MLLNGYAGYSTLDSLPETRMARFLTEVLRTGLRQGERNRTRCLVVKASG
jgi:hypothetical protein